MNAIASCQPAKWTTVIRRFAVMPSLFAALLLIILSRHTLAELSSRQVYEQAAPAVVTLETYGADNAEIRSEITGGGSGVILHRDGIIVTNRHVIENASLIVARLANGSFFIVDRVLLEDEDWDMAFLSVPGRNLPVLAVSASDSPAVGDKVYAIGSPQGLEQTLSDGIISGLRREHSQSLPVIQTTAPVSPGSSGGALVDTDGRLVGITTFLVRGGQNLNFAVPAQVVRSLLDQALREKNAERTAEGRAGRRREATAAAWESDYYLSSFSAQSRALYLKKRLNMATEQLSARGISDQRVLEAMRKMPMELFAPPDVRHLVYADAPVPVGFDETISQPYMCALMLELLHIRAADRVLELKTGAGYLSALLGRLGADVHTVETNPSLFAKARALFRSAGLRNIHVHYGDAAEGWEPTAPYDVIIATAAFPGIPYEVVSQLAPGGRFLFPLGADPQKLVVILKTEDGEFYTKVLSDIRFGMMPPLGE
jgi:protein-L-isoaspartate(D-aspartate) O-methyltransferase